MPPWDRESNEEYDDGYTRESFERQDEDTADNCEDPADRIDGYDRDADRIDGYDRDDLGESPDY